MQNHWGYSSAGRASWMAFRGVSGSIPLTSTNYLLIPQQLSLKLVLRTRVGVVFSYQPYEIKPKELADLVKQILYQVFLNKFEVLHLVLE